MARGRIWLSITLCTLGLIQPLPAQRRTGAPPARPQAERDANAVRAELAAVLLQARRYDEAAREYRMLLSRDPASLPYRLGLARALAWGEHPREAEQELRVLHAWLPRDQEIDRLLRTVRASFQPSAAEAAAWYDERPAHVPYRLALARALVREGDAPAALPHYDALLALDTTVALRREAVQAQIEGRDYVRATQLLQRELFRSPGDSAARHALATVLVQDAQPEAARAQYDTLIAWHPTAALLLERAQLNAGRRDLDAAEADAQASVLAGAHPDAYLLLGDLRRSRGNFSEARLVYGYARMMAPDDPAIAIAFAQLARDEHPIVAFLPDWEAGPSWAFRTTTMTDNAGALYATIGARRAAALPFGPQATVDVELRRMAEGLDAFADGVSGVALRAGLWHQLVYGILQARVGARVGVSQHADGAFPLYGLASTFWLSAWALSLELAAGAAYPSLLTTTSIRPPDGDEPLQERTLRAALGGPLGSADIAFDVQRTTISDDNVRTSVQALLRYPLQANLIALYAANGIWFTERSPLYWDPLSYLAGAAGLEYARRPARGAGFALRLLAGPAHTTELEEDTLRPERVPRAGHEVSSTALQLSGGIEWQYRSDQSELSALVTYGSGRTGAYRRLEVSLQARMLR